MKRRTFLQAGLASALVARVGAAVSSSRFEQAADVLRRAVDGGQVKSAVLHVVERDSTSSHAFGEASSTDAMFLLGSISKPIAMTALMTLFDKREFKLDDPVQKFLPKFSGEGREKVTLRHLMSHVSGLPDQLAENKELRQNHAPLSEFVEHAMRAPLAFSPGSKHQYSSMGILLAARVAELLSGTDIAALVDRVVFRPLGMKHSAQGVGRFSLADLVPVQIESAAIEAGGGDPAAKDWDWNSPWWRKLGAPWGGTHASAPDLGLLLGEFLNERGTVVKPETARLMTRNQNPPGVTPWGVGFKTGAQAGTPGCSNRTFGHEGSTGTLAWADPATHTICVVLTSLPGRAVNPHPRHLASAKISAREG